APSTACASSRTASPAASRPPRSPRGGPLHLSRRAPMLKKLGLSLAALLLSLLAAELLVRLASAAPQIYVIPNGRFQLSRHPKIGYEPAPLAYSGQELSFYDYRGASNRLGYRDSDHTPLKPPGVFRIVVLGDSIAAGLEVDRYENVFPSILEKLLRERGLRAE